MFRKFESIGAIMALAFIILVTIGYPTQDQQIMPEIPSTMPTKFDNPGFPSQPPTTPLISDVIDVYELNSNPQKYVGHEIMIKGWLRGMNNDQNVQLQQESMSKRYNDFITLSSTTGTDINCALTNYPHIKQFCEKYLKYDDRLVTLRGFFYRSSFELGVAGGSNIAASKYRFVPDSTIAEVIKTSNGDLSEFYGCRASGGAWRNFSNGCADYCHSQPKNDKLNCTFMETNSCECPSTSCWNGITCTIHK